MKKLRQLLLLATLPLCTVSLQAQNYNLPDPTEEEIDNTLHLGFEESDALYNDWRARTYLEIAPGCENLSSDPYFPDEVYKERLQRIAAVVELPYNNIVRSYIDRYTKKSRKQVQYLLGAMNFYAPIFEEQLEKYGVPLELKYLPVIESALRPTATSPVGAAGLWQFMLTTGKQYKLRIDSRVDERRDPVKSSEAAAKLLRDLYNIYKDWALVLAAYNCGPGNVNKAMRRSGSNDYWVLYNYLPKETRGYVPAFIAATYVMNYYCDHGICAMQTKYPMATDTVIIRRDINLHQIAECCNIDIDILKALNPQYRTNVIPGHSGPCILRMPDQMINTFASYGDDIYRYRASELLTRRSEVEVGGYSPSVNQVATTSAALSGRPEGSVLSESAGRPMVAPSQPDAAVPARPRADRPANQPRATEAEETRVETRRQSSHVEEYTIQPVETNTRPTNVNPKSNPNLGYKSSSTYMRNSSKRVDLNGSSYARRRTGRTAATAPAATKPVAAAPATVSSASSAPAAAAKTYAPSSKSNNSRSYSSSLRASNSSRSNTASAPASTSSKSNVPVPAASKSSAAASAAKPAVPANYRSRHGHNAAVSGKSTATPAANAAKSAATSAASTAKTNAGKAASLRGNHNATAASKANVPAAKSATTAKGVSSKAPVAAKSSAAKTTEKASVGTVKNAVKSSASSAKNTAPVAGKAKTVTNTKAASTANAKTASAAKNAVPAKKPAATNTKSNAAATTKSSPSAAKPAAKASAPAAKSNATSTKANAAAPKASAASAKTNTPVKSAAAKSSATKAAAPASKTAASATKPAASSGKARSKK